MFCLCFSLDKGYNGHISVVSLLLGKYFMFWKLRYNILTFGINKVFFYLIAFGV